MPFCWLPPKVFVGFGNVQICAMNSNLTACFLTLPFLGLPVAGQTSEFVNQVLEKTAEGDPTGGLVGLRIPMSKV